MRSRDGAPMVTGVAEGLAATWAMPLQEEAAAPRRVGVDALRQVLTPAASQLWRHRLLARRELVGRSAIR